LVPKWRKERPQPEGGGIDLKGAKVPARRDRTRRRRL